MKQTTQEAHDDFILRCECELAHRVAVGRTTSTRVHAGVLRASLAAGWTPSDLRNAVRREKRSLERAAKITAASAATLSR